MAESDWISALQRLVSGGLPQDTALHAGGPFSGPFSRTERAEQGGVEALPLGDPADPISQIAMILSPFLNQYRGMQASAPALGIPARRTLPTPGLPALPETVSQRTEAAVARMRALQEGGLPGTRLTTPRPREQMYRADAPIDQGPPRSPMQELENAATRGSLQPRRDPSSWTRQQLYDERLITEREFRSQMSDEELRQIVFRDHERIRSRPPGPGTQRTVWTQADRQYPYDPASASVPLPRTSPQELYEDGIITQRELQERLAARSIENPLIDLNWRELPGESTSPGASASSRPRISNAHNAQLRPHMEQNLAYDLAEARDAGITVDDLTQQHARNVSQRGTDHDVALDEMERISAELQRRIARLRSTPGRGETTQQGESFLVHPDASESPVIPRSRVGSTPGVSEQLANRYNMINQNLTMDLQEARRRHVPVTDLLRQHEQLLSQGTPGDVEAAIRALSRLTQQLADRMGDIPF